MKKIVIVGRNDSGKSTLLGEVYRGLKSRGYHPLAIGSGTQDEKPYLMKGVDSASQVIAIPRAGEDIVSDIERVIRQAIHQIKEKNNLIQHARRALEELNKVRSVLELGQLTQRDLPPCAPMPNLCLIESVGTNDGYKSPEGRRVADILLSIVPADIKSEIIMDQGNVLMDEADLIAVTKIDRTPRSIANSNIKLLQRIYRHKPIIPVVATEGVHIHLVVEEILRKLNDPAILIKDLSPKKSTQEIV